jgi:hypothetical protein
MLTCNPLPPKHSLDSCFRRDDDLPNFRINSISPSLSTIRVVPAVLTKKFPPLSFFLVVALLCLMAFPAVMQASAVPKEEANEQVLNVLTFWQKVHKGVASSGYRTLRDESRRFLSVIFWAGGGIFFFL